MNNFTTIDFETATTNRSSVCAVGIITVNDNKITDRYYTLVKPPGNFYFSNFSKIHGITPEHTLNSPVFTDIASEISQRINNRILVAHNISFEKSVLNACCEKFKIPYDMFVPYLWEDTCKIYRQKNFKSCKLSDLCKHFEILLDHHNALSDAIACAKLYIIKDLVDP